jgi:hypothetical protein
MAVVLACGTLAVVGCARMSSPTTAPPAPASATALRAVLITYGADSPPNPVAGRSVREAVERYAFWHAGWQVVLTLAGPQGADDVAPWWVVTNSLRWQA